MLRIGEITRILDNSKFEVLTEVTYDHSQHDLYCTKHVPPLNIKYIALARTHTYEYEVGDKVVIDITEYECQCEKLPPIIQYKLVD